MQEEVGKEVGCEVGDVGIEGLGAGVAGEVTDVSKNEGTGCFRFGGWIGIGINSREY